LAIAKVVAQFVMGGTEAGRCVKGAKAAQLLAHKEAVLGVFILVVVGFWFTRKLPGEPLTKAQSSEAPAAATPAAVSTA